jgi:glycosyltransferase involved in cell wall biosynthesis
MGVDREHSVSLFTRAENIGILRDSLSERIEVHLIGQHLFNAFTRLGWEQVVLPGMIGKIKPDVLFCPGNIIPLWSPVPTVVALQNAAPFCVPVPLRDTGMSNWAWFRLLGIMMRLSAGAATRVIFVSHYLKDVFIRRFNFPGDRGDVIYHGRDGLPVAKPDDVFLKAFGISRPYVLCVSDLYAYKNIPALIEGYFLARRALQRKDLRLVIVGRPIANAYYERLKQIIRQHQLENWILLTGGLPYPAIGTLLGGCEWFVFQSTCENCPNALIEALSAGVPIACSKASVMPEIAGDAALYFDPFRADDIARALSRMGEDSSLRAGLRALALREAGKFPTWDEVGQTTLRSLERAVNGM